MQKTSHTLLFIFCALILGSVLGFFAPDFANKLSFLSVWVLQLVKAAAAPLVFFAILEAIISFNIQGRDFTRLLGITFINSLCAVFLGIIIANLFQPGKYLSFLDQGKQKILDNINFSKLAGQQLPQSIVQPFLDNNIMPIVIIAVAFGFAWRVTKISYQSDKIITKAQDFISFLRHVFEKILTWVVRLVPVAVLGASSKLVATHGLATFGSLSHYVALCLFGMLMHFLLIYSSWVVFYIKISLQQFWRAVFEPALYAFSVNSSLVALPLTLAALDKLGVSRRAATLAACVGTNLNNDGIILYEGFTLLALAQASGVDMSISLQIFAALYCIVAAMGVAGVPEAGVVALTLVLSGLGLGTESLAVLLSVDWILARARSWLNTSSDMVSSLILDRMIKKT